MKLCAQLVGVALLTFTHQICVAAEKGEPEWNGTSLSTWIRETKGKPHAGKAYDVLFMDDAPTTNQTEAVKAIRQIGTNALPYLLTWTATEDKYWDGVFGLKALRELAAPAFDELLHRAESSDGDINRPRAIIALGSLGPAAAKAAPFLLSELNKGSLYAAVGLAEIGNPAAEVVPGMVRLLQRERNDWDRWIWEQREVVKAFGVLGTSASGATDELLAMLKDPEIANSQDWRVAQLRQSIVETLGQIRDARALPALVKLLEEIQEPHNIYQAALRRVLMRSLGEFGPAAKEALPILRKVGVSNETRGLDGAIAKEACRKIEAEH